MDETHEAEDCEACRQNHATFHQPRSDAYYEGYAAADQHADWARERRQDEARKLTLVGFALYAFGAGLIVAAGRLRH